MDRARAERGRAAAAAERRPPSRPRDSDAGAGPDDSDVGRGRDGEPEWPSVRRPANAELPCPWPRGDGRWRHDPNRATALGTGHGPWPTLTATTSARLTSGAVDGPLACTGC